MESGKSWKIVAHIIVIICLFILLIPIFFIVRYQIADVIKEKEHFKEQLGTYILDLKRTNLGSYSRDSLIYEKLEITFKNDATFQMNMRAPFIYDSVGRWNARGCGLEDWNWLWYKQWGYNDYKKNRGNQFSGIWTTDSVFCINGATPQEGFPFIQEIYFKKKRTKTVEEKHVDSIIRKFRNG